MSTKITMKGCWEQNDVTEAKPTRRMSVCSSGVQRRKKLENKQKFVFDEKDVVAPPPRAAVRSSVQVKPYFFFMLFAFIPVPFLYLKDRLARAREGKDGRPPRFDPVLDEVAAKLEKEVSKCSALCCEILYLVFQNRWHASSWERSLPRRLEHA